MLIGTQQNSTLGENESQTSPGGLGEGLSYSRWGEGISTEQSLAHSQVGVEEIEVQRLDNTIQI